MELRFRSVFAGVDFSPVVSPVVSTAGRGRGWLLGIRGFWVAPRFSDLAARSRRLRSPHTLFFAARYRNDDRAFAVRQATWSWAGSARLVLYDGVPYGTSLLALPSVHNQLTDTCGIFPFKYHYILLFRSIRFVRLGRQQELKPEIANEIGLIGACAFKTASGHK